MGRSSDPREAAGSAASDAAGTAGGGEPTAAVVITGSTRGLGFALAREFLRLGCRVLVSGRSVEAVREVVGRLQAYGARVEGQSCDVTDPAQVGALWDGALRRWGRVDVWINNAGVAQEYLRAWELPTEEVIRIVETNILGVMHGSRVAMRGMRGQGYGAIYNVEGWGSDGKRRPGLAVYGTTKRAVRYFSRCLAEEAAGEAAPGEGAPAEEASERPEEQAAGPRYERVLVGTLSPGMMVTDFLLEPMARMADAERLRRVVDILGDRPESVAAFLAPRILANRRNGVRIAWLTGPKVMVRFARALLRRGSRGRDLFAAVDAGEGGRPAAGPRERD
ncbi:MAG: SDR family oxidoreductase [Spirochaetales bacterium]|nr:SDR family oxidoreductase [Spirochaetales bacterium]